VAPLETVRGLSDPLAPLCAAPSSLHTRPGPAVPELEANADLAGLVHVPGASAAGPLPG
jgi:hypothetical protein